MKLEFEWQKLWRAYSMLKRVEMKIVERNAFW